jgi:hypothetical protein
MTPINQSRESPVHGLEHIFDVLEFLAVRLVVLVMLLIGVAEVLLAQVHSSRAARKIIEYLGGIDVNIKKGG